LENKLGPGFHVVFIELEAVGVVRGCAAAVNIGVESGFASSRLFPGSGIDRLDLGWRRVVVEI
jgi:hypothetical protein